MLCIDNKSTDVYFNLAAEEYLLKNSDEDFFMVWRSRPSVVVGRHQNVYEEVNIGFAEEKGIKIARRFSGGGAVFQDLGNVNISFIETSVCANFDRFTHKTLDMLSSLGIEAESDERRAINVNGLKISGSAQGVYKDRVLYHCTLLHSSDLEMLERSLEFVPGQDDVSDNAMFKGSVKSVKSPVLNTAELMAVGDTDELIRRIIGYYLEKERKSNKYEFSIDECVAINRLRESKYETHSWIYKGKN